MEREIITNLKKRKIINCHNKTIIPGFIDLDVHGGYGYSLMEGTIASITNLAKLVSQEGVTKFCYATVTASNKEITKILAIFNQYMLKENNGKKAYIVGLYLEGSFISPLQKGAHTSSLLQIPNSELIKSWQQLSNNNIKFVVYASEIDLKGADKTLNFTKILLENNIISTIGHSNASFSLVVKTMIYGLKHDYAFV